MQIIIKTTIFAKLSKEYMYDVANKLGLSDEAANYFRHFTEVPLFIEIDKETGEVLDVKVPL